jgi:hypothetical protein
VVDKDSAHHLGCNTVEVSAIPPLDPGLVRKAQPCLVDQRRRLESVSRTLASHAGPGDSSQFLIHQPDQFVRCAGLSVSDPPEQISNFAGRLHHGSPVCPL